MNMTRITKTRRNGTDIEIESESEREETHYLQATRVFVILIL